MGRVVLSPNPVVVLVFPHQVALPDVAAILWVPASCDGGVNFLLRPFAPRLPRKGEKQRGRAVAPPVAMHN